MGKRFTLYPMAGVLTTGIAAASVAYVPMLGISAVGLTAGIVTRDRRRCIRGFLWSLLGVLVPAISVPVLPSSELVRIWYFDYTWPAWVLGLFCALVGAAVPLRAARLMGPAVAGAAGSVASVACAGLLFRRLFPPGSSFEMELWELLTVLAAVPIVGLGTWVPVERAAGGRWRPPSA